jgi:integrase
MAVPRSLRCRPAFGEGQAARPTRARKWPESGHISGCRGSGPRRRYKPRHALSRRTEARFEETNGHLSPASFARSRRTPRAPGPAFALPNGDPRPRTEATGLRPRDVDLKGYLLHVRGKGDKDRVVPIDTALEPLLVEWRSRRPPGSRFFSTLAGDELDGRHVRRMVKRRAKSAGIESDVHRTCSGTRARLPG